MKRVLTSLIALTALVAPTFDAAPAHAQEADVRLEFQGRMDVVNTFGIQGVTSPLGGGGVLSIDVAMVPFATIGVRLLDDMLFVGLGVGYSAASVTDCADVSDGGCAQAQEVQSSSTFSISPVVNFEFLSSQYAGFYLAVALNFGAYGESTTTTEVQGQPTVTVETDGNFMWGIDIGLGIRGKINEALSVGTEWGWAIMGLNTGDDDSEDDILMHGLWGTLFVAASFGL